MNSLNNPRGGFSLGSGRLFRRPVPMETPPPYVEDRILDSLPGVLAWTSLILVIVGAIYAPWEVFTVAAVIAAYMAFRLALAGIANVIGLRYIRRWEATDWRAEYERRRKPSSLAWGEVRHMFVVPNYKEDLSVLRQTLARVAESPLARTQVIVVLAMEATDPRSHETADTLQAEFADKFLHLMATYHPGGLSGEIPGKSANEAWATRHAKRELVEHLGMNPDHILITISDADSLLHPRHLEALTCLYAAAPAQWRHETVWQAPIRYHGNVWSINPVLNLVQTYSAAWELAYLAGWWWRGLPISTYSLSLRMADEVGYWDPDVIAEDWHMFIKCYYARRGRLRLAPIYLPFSAYAVTGDGFIDACRNRYSQTLRHAWGAKEITYTFKQSVRHPVPLHRALSIMSRVTHDHLAAGAGWVVMTIGTQLPLLLYPEILQRGFLSLPFVLIQGSMAIVAVMGLLFWVIDMRLRPPRTRVWTWKERLLTIGSFAALPALVLFLMAIPVLEAQTRLMLGISLDYRVARKV